MGRDRDDSQEIQKNAITAMREFLKKSGDKNSDKEADEDILGRSLVGYDIDKVKEEIIVACSPFGTHNERIANIIHKINSSKKHGSGNEYTLSNLVKDLSSDEDPNVPTPQKTYAPKTPMAQQPGQPSPQAPAPPPSGPAPAPQAAPTAMPPQGI